MAQSRPALVKLITYLFESIDKRARLVELPGAADHRSLKQTNPALIHPLGQWRSQNVPEETYLREEKVSDRGDVLWLRSSALSSFYGLLCNICPKVFHNEISALCESTTIGGPLEQERKIKR